MFGITRSIATPLRRATLAFAPAAIATACARTMASKTLFVGNLTWTARSEDLATLFGEYGDVHSVRIMTDRDTGRSRGFGFIEMAEEAAEKAVAELDGKDFRGRDLRVNYSEPKAPREGGFRREGGGGGFGGGSRGGDRGSFGGDRGDRGSY